MDILQILLIVGTLHLLVDRVVDGLQRIEGCLYGIREQRLHRVGDGNLLYGLLCGLCRLLDSLLHTIETLVGSLCGLVELCQQILADGKIDILARRDAMDQALGECIGTPLHVLGPLLALVDGGQNGVFVLIVRIVEIRRLDGARHPLLGVGVGSGGHFLTAEFILALGLRVLYPLVVLHVTTDRDSRSANAELGVDQRVFCRSHSGTTDQFALERGVFLVGVLHLNIGIACLVEHFLCLHGTSFVPPQQRCSQDKHQESATNSLE